MLFGQDRDQLRNMYCQAWAQHRSGQPAGALQAELVAVIMLHPEYQSLLEHPEQAMGREYLPEMGETNPFLHMGMHLALREQISTDRPPGIRELYRALGKQIPDPHERDHQMMECLAEAIWQAQRDGQPPDEQRYLDCIKTLATGA